MYQIETFKKIKPEKKIKKNIKYGTSGNTGKNYTNRSFGGGMSNRKYTKKQVKKHELLPNELRTGEVSNIKPVNKELVPPLYPTTLGSTGPNNRSGYINPNNTTTIPNPNNINKYIYPAQELVNVEMESDKNNYKIYIKNKNIMPDNNSNDNNSNNGYSNRWNDYDGTYNGGYYGPNAWFTYNPYLYGPNPYGDNYNGNYDNNDNKNIIINNYRKETPVVVEDMEDIENIKKNNNSNSNNNFPIWSEYKYYIVLFIIILIILLLILYKLYNNNLLKK
jgi:hypothetical protein